MKKLWIIWAMLAMVLFGGVAWAQSVPVADGLQLPLSNYTMNDGCLEWGGWGADDSAYEGQRHLADDECSAYGTDVFAAANGLVRFADNRGNCPSNWGPLMVLESIFNGNNICVIYGHVVRDTSVNEGDIVVRGQKIGEIADGTGCWSDHIHFSVYLGPYGFPTGAYPSWLHGYLLPATWPGSYTDPIQFVNDNPSSSSSVARFPNGTISQAILSKYNTLANQGHNLGDPWDNGGSAFVHEVNGMWIQDFQDRRDLGGESNGYYHPYTAIFHYNDPWMSRPAWLLKEGFWDYYMNHTGWITFGCPVTDEYLVNSSTWQTFHRFGPNYDNNSEDYQVFYFRWNPDTWVLDVVNQYLQPVLYSELIVTLETASGSTDDASRTQDGVYHSGIHLANFGEPLNLMDQQDYSGFYAMVNQSVIPIDNFSLDGNLSISLQPTVDPPLAAFAVDFSSGEAPHTVQFTDQSTGLVDDWFWDFGDGSTSASQNPSHTYTEAGVYSVSLQVSNQGGVDLLEMADYITVTNRVVDTDDRPLSFALYHNYPNPFNPQTVISYTLPQTDYVELDVYDISGAKVCSLVSGLQTRGLHQVTWDARDSSGQLLNSGVYFCHLRSGGKIETQKMILLK